MKGIGREGGEEEGKVIPRDIQSQQRRREREGIGRNKVTRLFERSTFIKEWKEERETMEMKAL